MALGTIPSWLNLPNFVQAMREGAATGLAARRTDIEEQQAADRMALAYEHLAEKEHAANQLAQYRMALEEGRQQRAADALAQRTAQAVAVDQYRKDQSQHAAAVLAETIKHNRALEAKANKPTLDPITSTEMHEDVRDLHAIDSKLKNAEPGSQEAVDLMQEKYNTRAKLAGYRKQLTGQSSPADALLRNTTPQTAKPNPYIVGRRYGKLKYKGGDPYDESSWESAE